MAAAALRTAVELDPEEPAPLTELGLLLRGTGQAAEAAACLRGAADALDRWRAEGREVTTAAALLRPLLEEAAELEGAGESRDGGTRRTADEDPTVAEYLRELGRLQEALDTPSSGEEV